MQIKLRVIRLLVIIQTIATITVLWLTSYLGIIPILKGVEKIKEDSEIPIIGSYEFRYLAKTYNKMYSAFKKSIESLNYEASHDKLTGLYNRAGYDVLRSGIDLNTSAVLLIDADNFKSINDNYGHVIGDCVLKKIAAQLKNTFRVEDYICRIGGDEFVVFMRHVHKGLSPLIEDKIGLINRTLTDRKLDSLPPISISVGIAFGEDEADIDSLIEHADEALYVVKENGRRGYSFYGESA
jgi:diguanylate cyclase (GGDEF)-like protein